MYWIPGKLRTPLHRRSGREGSRASRGGPGRGTFRKSIGMAVYSGFLCVAPPWPSSRSWFCFEGPDPFPCPGKFVGSFSRQSRCSAPPFPSSMSVHTCSHFCYAGAPVSQCPGVPMPAHRKWLLPATVVWQFPTDGRLIVGGWEHAASRIREIEPCACPTPPGGLESNPSCLGAYFRTTRHAKMCARPTFKARRNYVQTPLGRTAVHGWIPARLDGAADEIINCAHEDGPWQDNSNRFWLHIRFRGSLKTPDGASFGWSRRMNKALERTGRALAAGRTVLAHCKAPRLPGLFLNSKSSRRPFIRPVKVGSYRVVGSSHL